MIRVLNNRKLCRLCVSSLLIAVLCCPFMDRSVQAARGQFNANQVKLVFLFNLTNFVFWPESSFTSSDCPFIVTVLGKDPFGKSLEEIVRNEKVGQHPIVIKRIDKLSELEPTHILYIDRAFAGDLATIIKQTTQPGILTVSDFPDFTADGGAVNLLVQDKRLLLELNLAAAKKNGLKFSSKLLQVAKIVGSRQP